MRRGPWRVIAGVTAAAVTAGCASGAALQRDVRGHKVEVRSAAPDGGREAARVDGELIAAGEDRIVVLGKNGPVEVPLPQVREVRVYRRTTFSAARAGQWALVGGLTTSLALMAACGSVEDTSGCAGVGAVVGLTWLAVGGAAVAGAHHGARESVLPERWEYLSGYARFPQGLPEGLDPRTIASPPDHPLER